jgi:hypothetical protein
MGAAVDTNRAPPERNSKVVYKVRYDLYRIFQVHLKRLEEK